MSHIKDPPDKSEVPKERKQDDPKVIPQTPVNDPTHSGDNVPLPLIDPEGKNEQLTRDS